MVIITENDVSQWEDQTGVLYHFPKRYEKYLKPGDVVELGIDYLGSSEQNVVAYES